MGRENSSERKTPIAPPRRRSMSNSVEQEKRPVPPNSQPSVPELEIESLPTIQTDRPIARKKSTAKRISHGHEPVIAPPGQAPPKRADAVAIQKVEHALDSTVEEYDPEEGEYAKDLTFIEMIQDVVIEDGPSWLVSSVVHTSIVLILWLIAVQVKPKEPGIEAIWSQRIGEANEDIDKPPSDSENLVEVHVLQPLDPIPDPWATPPEVPTITPNAPTAAVRNPEEAPPGHAPDGLDPGARAEMINGGGGNKDTEDAVLLALAWLAKQQRADGSWSLVGPYPNGASRENKTAATAMALLAFQGHRDTTVGGEYRDNVRRGWDWLLQQQSADGKFTANGMKWSHPYYTHAQATIALCELLHMSKDEKYREPAEMAVRLLLRDQSPLGGWKYSPGVGSDLSVTGWCLMALQSARMAGIEVPEDNLNQISNFLDKVSHEGGSQYAYMMNHTPSRSMTAEGLLCREYRGWLDTDRRLLAGADYLTEPENLVSYAKGEYDVYYWYYATQALHHLGGEHWTRWNNVMKQELPSHQVKEGRDAGSWSPVGDPQMEKLGEGGRLYVTCLSTYCLEVYYRHLPLYWNVYSVLPSLEESSAPAISGLEEAAQE
jgi:hypothetical protein